MAIHVNISEHRLRPDGLCLRIQTTHSSYPGAVEDFYRIYDDRTLTAAQIKDAINLAVTLYWQAYAAQSWDI
jgi:hypothetical protein